jgi:hypothetical protein
MPMIEGTEFDATRGKLDEWYAHQWGLFGRFSPNDLPEMFQENEDRGCGVIPAVR